MVKKLKIAMVKKRQRSLKSYMKIWLWGFFFNVYENARNIVKKRAKRWFLSTY